ncbi:MAG TPA: 30S ribosome-binding factor RbfA [Thermoanaerobaculia bacterium]|jgi:ribosome-binding factor A|nr:30S ribosome-binding factor RbfA [Thermoanaerobaculia bacterium]
MSRRTDRVGDLLRAELSDLLTREVADPRVRLATVISVETSPDLRHADVSVSVLGAESERREAIEALRGAQGFLRSRLARKVRLRNVPELRFRLDRGAEHSQRISDLLESLHDDESA